MHGQFGGAPAAKCPPTCGLAPLAVQLRPADATDSVAEPHESRRVRRKRQTDRKFKPQSQSTQYTLNPHRSSTTLCKTPPHQSSHDYRPLSYDIARDLIGTTNKTCTNSLTQHCQSTTLITPSQRLEHAYPRSATYAITAVQDYQPTLPWPPALTHRSPLYNYQLRVSPACQWPHTLSSLELKFQQPGAILNNHTSACFNRNADLSRIRVN